VLSCADCGEVLALDRLASEADDAHICSIPPPSRVAHHRACPMSQALTDEDARLATCCCPELDALEAEQRARGARGWTWAYVGQEPVQEAE
jgi:hypothetical protein